MAGVVLLKGSVKHYDWGGFDFIPSLLQINNSEKKPYAEYWLGTHPQAKNKVISGGIEISLSQFLKNNNAADFPFLFKALDVKDMLSIQVHPSKKEAEKGFKEENEKGIPLDAPHRNYKDENHKPEMMVALGEFWLLHGFKSQQQMKQVLENTKELNFLLPVFGENNYRQLYKEIMEMPQAEVNRHLQPLIDRIIPLYKQNKLSKAEEDFWAARAAVCFTNGVNIDRGIFSIYLFNLVKLEKDEAIFQDAGLPHAYLEGRNIELMASSDNVLRGGLTSKHIDVPELLKHVKCEPTEPAILKGEKKGHEIFFHTPASEFELSRIDLKKGEEQVLRPVGAEILLLTEGVIECSDENNMVEIHPGEPSAVVFSQSVITLTAKEDAVVFKAKMPIA